MRLGAVLGGVAQGFDQMRADQRAQDQQDFMNDQHAKLQLAQGALALAQQQAQTPGAPAPAAPDPTAIQVDPTPAAPAANVQAAPAAPTQAAATPSLGAPVTAVGTPADAAAAPQWAASNTSPVANEIRAVAHNKGIPAPVAEAMVMRAGVESDYGAASPNLFQFSGDTAKDLGMTDVNNLHQQVAGGLKNGMQGYNTLKGVLGQEPTPTEIGVYHEQGPAGSKALLTADPNASAADVLRPLYKSDQAAEQAIDKNWNSKFGPLPENATVGQYLLNKEAATRAQATGDWGRLPGQLAQPTAAGLPTANAPSSTPVGTAPVWSAPTTISASGPDEAYTAGTNPDGSPNIRTVPAGQMGKVTSLDIDRLWAQKLAEQGLGSESQAAMKQALENESAQQKILGDKLTLSESQAADAFGRAQQMYLGGDKVGAIQLALQTAHALPTGVQHQVQTTPDGQAAVSHWDTATGKLIGVDPIQDVPGLLNSLSDYSSPTRAFQARQEAHQASYQNALGTAALSNARTAQAEEQARAPLYGAQAGLATAQGQQSQAEAGLIGAQTESERAMAPLRAQAVQLGNENTARVNAIDTQLADPNLPADRREQLVGIRQQLTASISQAPMAINGGQALAQYNPATRSYDVFSPAMGGMVPMDVYAAQGQIAKDPDFAGAGKGGKIYGARDANQNFGFYIGNQGYPTFQAAKEALKTQHQSKGPLDRPTAAAGLARAGIPAPAQ